MWMRLIWGPVGEGWRQHPPGLWLGLREGPTLWSPRPPLLPGLRELSTSTVVGQPGSLGALALPPGWSRLFGGGVPIVQGDSLVTKALLKSSQCWSNTGTRTLMKEQGLLCVAAAAETSAREVEMPLLVCVGYSSGEAEKERLPQQK